MDGDAPHRKFDHAYAILRIDPLQSPNTPPDAAVTVKRIVWSEQAAAAEVARLNALRPGTAPRYFWQVTRVERRPAAGPGASESSAAAPTEAESHPVAAPLPAA
jgi:hypothetical protein